MTGRPKACDLHQLRGVERHAGRDDDQVLAAKGQQSMAAGFDHDPRFEQGGNLLGQRLGAARFGDRDLRALPAQKQRGGEARLAQPNDQYSFAFSDCHRLQFPISAVPL